MSTVYTFYHQIPQIARPEALLGLWKYTWEKRGWNTRVLVLGDAQANPRYDVLRGSVETKTKSINPGEYDLMCWLRWLAFEQVGGGMMTDYDVINRSLTPDYNSQAPVTVHDLHRVPCCVSATKEGAASIVSGIIDMPEQDVEHYSDMYWFQEQQHAIDPICVEFHSDGWQTAPAVHFANSACGRWRNEQRANATREQLVRKFMLT